MKKREKKRGLTTLLMLLLFVAVASAQGLSKKFNVNFKNTPLPSALKTIGKQSGVRVEFAYDDVKSYKVSANLKSVNAETAVKSVISNHPLTYKVVGGKFIIVSKEDKYHSSFVSGAKSENTEANDPANVVQSGKTIRGKVVDENHQPLPGVSVKCSNSRMGTYTNADGEFSFVLPENHGLYLTFSYLGMQSQKVKLSPRNLNHMQIVMHEDAGALDEVVVTGYQILDKRSLTSAVTSVRAEDVMRSDVSSIDQMLEGKIPDLLVSNNSGEIGVAPKIRIRGTSTLVGNREPLWVVDGIVVKDPVSIAPEELNDPDYVNRIGNAISGINPQDIERIDVLKDAAATAIYGTRAANGVIVITTKKGYSGKPRVSYNVNVNYKRRPRYSDHSVDVMSSKERVQFSRELFADHYLFDVNDNLVGYEGLLNSLYNHEITNDEFNSQVAGLEAMNTDWFDLLCKDSWSSQHTASISGGSDRSRYYASIGYNADNDVVKYNKNKRYTASMNIDNTFSKFFTASVSFNGYNYDRDTYQSSIEPMQYAYETSRAIPAYDANGKYAFYNRKVTSTQSYQYNILNELANSSSLQKTTSFTVGANLKFTFTDWLRANLVLSHTNQHTKMEGYWGDKTFYAATLRGAEYGDEILRPSESLLPQGGELSTNTVDDRSYTARLQFDANKMLGLENQHGIDATVGLEIYHDTYKTYAYTARGYYPDRGMSFVTDIDPNIYSAYAAWATSNVPSIADNITNTVSLYAAFTYSYKGMARINLNGRVDGSNKFGDRSNEKFLPIWSASGSLDLKRLGVLDYKWIDYMNFKASYGFQGNMLDTEYPTMTIRKGAYNTYYNSFTSSFNKYPNPKLKWETTRSINLGLDFSMFDNRLHMELAYYYKKTKDAFMTKRISSVNGTESYVINGGDVTNKGYSFDITLTPIRTKNFRWTASTSISKVINNMDSRPDTQTYDLSDFLNGTALVEGKSVNTFYSYRFLGLSPVDGGPLFDDYQDNPSKLQGLSKYDTYTLVLEASGKRDPDIQGSLTNTFRYKNWRANFSLAYSFGAKTRLFAMYGSAASGGAYSADIRPDHNYSRDYIKRWKNPGDEQKTNIPAIISMTSDSYSKYSTHYSTTGNWRNTGGLLIANNSWDMYDYSDVRAVSADYLKFQSASITYEFDKNMLSHIGLQRIAITASAYNLFTICDSKLKGQTPTQGGFTTIQLSERPSYSLGINLIF